MDSSELVLFQIFHFNLEKMLTFRFMYFCFHLRRICLCLRTDTEGKTRRSKERKRETERDRKGDREADVISHVVEKISQSR